MRIGVICEGPTDFYAIESFFRDSLSREGIVANFVALQPELDNTQPEAGWGNVLLWLSRNPPNIRIQKYFEGGLFGGNLATEVFDCLLLQMDTDILGDVSFSLYAERNLAFTPDAPESSEERADEIRRVLTAAKKCNDMTEADATRHVLAPAVEATEAWCVAAFETPTRNCEDLEGQGLKDAFMSAFTRSEGRTPTPPYANVNKEMGRRKNFCLRHESGSDRVKSGCVQFERISIDLRDIAILRGHATLPA